MNRYDLQAIKIRLAHCRTGEQRRKVIDEYPELKGWGVARVKDVLLMDQTLQSGRTLPEQKLTNARKVRWRQP